MRVKVVVVESLEASQGGLFAVEQLDHPDTRETLLQERVHACQTVPDVPVCGPDARAEDEGGPGDEGEHAEGDQGQVGVHAEHRGHDEEQHEQVPKDRDQSRTEQLVQGLDVRGDAGHEPAHRVPVVEPQVELLELPEDLRAEIVHHPLAQPRRHERLHVLEDEDHDGDGQVDDGEKRQQAAVVGRDGLVEGDHGEVGTNYRRQRREHEENDSAGDLQAVRAQIAHQACHQARIVRLAEDLFLVAVVLLRHDSVVSSRAGRTRDHRRARHGRNLRSGLPQADRARPANAARSPMERRSP